MGAFKNIKPSGLFCKEIIYHIRSSGLRIKPAGLFCKEIINVSAQADYESSLPACSVRKLFIISAQADCESSLPACSVRKLFIISAQADCESAFRGELCSPGFRISLRAAAQPITLTPVQTRLADRQGEYGAPLRSTPD